MKVRKVELTFDECSEIMILLDRRIESIQAKLNDLTARVDPRNPFDTDLLSYWVERFHALTTIYGKLCCKDSCEV